VPLRIGPPVLAVGTAGPWLAFAGILDEAINVSFKGTVKNRVRVLPPLVKLPDGTPVEVTPLE
jgi:hypothetical protein